MAVKNTSITASFACTAAAAALTGLSTVPEAAAEALLKALHENREGLQSLIIELPARIVSVERLQILRLTLQNTALRVQRLERELQVGRDMHVAGPLATHQLERLALSARGLPQH